MKKREPQFDVRMFRVGRRWVVNMCWASNGRTASQGVTKYRQWRSALHYAETLADDLGGATIYLPDGHTTRCR